MTLHINYDHQCAACDADYIPYDVGIACPKCGLVESECFDFVPEAVESLRFNKADGSYLPAAWYIGNISDHILQLLFHLFSAYEESGGEEFQQFATVWLAQLDWGDQEYMREYLQFLSIRVYVEL